VRLCSNLHYPIVQQDKGNSLLRAEPVVYRAVSITKISTLLLTTLEVTIIAKDTTTHFRLATRLQD